MRNRHWQTRTTRVPDPPAPSFACPSCDHPLTYVQSVTSGAGVMDRWDCYACRHCGGAFEYRHRTERLRRTN